MQPRSLSIRPSGRTSAVHESKRHTLSHRRQFSHMQSVHTQATWHIVCQTNNIQYVHDIIDLLLSLTLISV